MRHTRQIAIPTLVRIQPGVLDHLGRYATRHDLERLVVLHSQDLPEPLLQRLDTALAQASVTVLQRLAIREASLEQAQQIFANLDPRAQAILGFGGGKALDTAKYIAFLARLPYLAVPTSLSNDGFCSPQSSLTLAGRRRSLPAAMPFGVLLDTAVTLQAPIQLWWSGIGDLVSKLTAVHDWKAAARAGGPPVDDFAALLSDATVFQFIARPLRDVVGENLLGTALMLNGVAMEVCGSSRPASGSEHLISHALDAISAAPRLHGLQVGLATYLISQLQGQSTETIVQLFDATRFWDAFRTEPLSRSDWIQAVQLAPTLKPDFHTILSEPDAHARSLHLLHTDPRLLPLFTP